VHWRRGASTPSLHCWFVCCNQLNSRFLPDLRPGLQSCSTSNLTALPVKDSFSTLAFSHKAPMVCPPALHL
jgi:hypothetical protein